MAFMAEIYCAVDACFLKPNWRSELREILFSFNYTIESNNLHATLLSVMAQ